MGKFLDCANTVVLDEKAEYSSTEYDINDIYDKSPSATPATHQKQAASNSSCDKSDISDKSQSMRVSEGFLQPAICDKRVSDLIRWRDCTPEQLQNLWARVKQGEPIQIYSDTLGEPVWWVRDDEIASALKSQGISEVCYTVAELRELVGKDPEFLRDIHQLKRQFGGTLKPAPAQPEPDPLEGLRPYRITLDDGPQLIWLTHGLPPEQVLRAAAERYGPERVSLEPPSAGWPRLVDIPELPASNPPLPESPCPACASTYWWQARSGGPWRCRSCDGVDFDNQQDCTLTLPPAQPKTDATQPLDPDPDPDRALVCCRDCRRFELDQIGDGSGIGRCRLAVWLALV